ncbi:MAG: SDR family oxidoreductase [Cyanobacteriota bacterium]
MDYVLILGAGSDIAKALSHMYASKKYNIYLAGRKIDELEKDAKNLNIRYNIEAMPLFFDATEFEKHYDFYHFLQPKPTIVICIFGYQGEQIEGQKSFKETQKVIDTNYTGSVSILNVIANDFEEKQSGSIVGISSCAGDRGRAKNYIYGSAKGAFSIYLSGLRNRLSKSNVSVLTVKPGFVATKMTENMDLPEKLTAQPEEVAKDIFKAQQTKKDIIYTKWFWFFIMNIIKHIPEKMFKKMNI